MIALDIILTSENRKEILQLPIIPETLDVSFPHNNEVFTTIDGGDINLIGMPGLKGIQIACWIPTKEYSFAKSKVLAPQAKEFFTRYKRKRQPIRVVITSKEGWEMHNELYAIEEFVFGYDRVGDMTYTLSLTQYVKKKVK